MKNRRVKWNIFLFVLFDILRILYHKYSLLIYPLIKMDFIMPNNINPMFNNKFKLGIFSVNCSGGLAMTKVKES